MIGRKYTVLWELTSVKGAPTPPTPQSFVRASTLPNDKEADADDSDDDEPTVHSLPFRVLGTCYSTSRQEALKRHLSICMDKTDTYIFVKLETYIEPSNIVDSHAIAVFLKSSIHYKK